MELEQIVIKYNFYIGLCRLHVIVYHGMSVVIIVLRESQCFVVQ